MARSHLKKFEHEINPNCSVHLRGKLLYNQKSKYQNIEIVEIPHLGKCLLLDGVLQLSLSDEFIYHESIVHPALLAHPNPKKIVVIGGGDGGTLRELLKYPIEQIYLIELDKAVVDASKEYLPEIGASSFKDPRVKIIYGDGRKWLEQSSELFDIIIIDLTDPHGPSTLLFTKEFYEIVNKHLTSKGIMISDCDGYEFGGIFLNIIKTAGTIFSYVYPFQSYVSCYFSTIGFMICSNNNLDFMKNDLLVEKKIQDTKLNLRYYNASELASLFIKTKFLDTLLQKEWEISSDKKPLETE